MTPYLVGVLYLCLVWVFLFAIVGKNDRKEMLAMSILGAIAGPVVALLYTQDWWQPQLTVVFFNTPLGVSGLEDSLYAAALFGIVAVLPECILRRRERPPTERFLHSFFLVMGIVSAAALFMASLILFVEISSFPATLITVTLILGLIFSTRRDLAVPALVAGLAMPVIVIPAYVIPLAFFSTWIEDAWMLANFSGIRPLGIPIEEFLWTAVVSTWLSILWEYARGISSVRAPALGR
jgi:hypothetical protein